MKTRFNPRLRKYEMENSKDKLIEDPEIRQIVFDNMQKNEKDNQAFFNELDSDDLSSLSDS